MLQCTSAVRYCGAFNTLNPLRAAFLLAFDGKVSVRKDFTCDCEQRAQRLGLRICVSYSSHLIVPSSYSACSQFRYSSHEKKSFTKCDSNPSLVYGLHAYTAMRSRPKRCSMCTSMRIAASGVPKYFSRLVNAIPLSLQRTALKIYVSRRRSALLAGFRARTRHAAPVPRLL